MEKFQNRKQREQWEAMREPFLSMIGQWYARLAELLAHEVAARESEPDHPDAH